MVFFWIMVQKSTIVLPSLYHDTIIVLVKTFNKHFTSTNQNQLPCEWETAKECKPQTIGFDQAVHMGTLTGHQIQSSSAIADIFICTLQLTA